MYRIIHAIYSLTRDWKLDIMELRLPSAALALSPSLSWGSTLSTKSTSLGSQL